MDMLHLVDRLENLIGEGWHIPTSRYTAIDEERALEITDQMRISIPEEIKKAARVNQQRDRVLAEANEEAARIVQQARLHSEEMIDKHEMVKQAKLRADAMIEDARMESAKIAEDIDAYVVEQLLQLEHRYSRNLEEIRSYIQVMQMPEAEPVALEIEAQPMLNPMLNNAQAQQAPMEAPPAPAPHHSVNNVNREQINFDRPARAAVGNAI